MVRICIRSDKNQRLDDNKIGADDDVPHVFRDPSNTFGCAHVILEKSVKKPANLQM